MFKTKSLLLFIIFFSFSVYCQDDPKIIEWQRINEKVIQLVSQNNLKAALDTSNYWISYSKIIAKEFNDENLLAYAYYANGDILNKLKKYSEAEVSLLNAINIFSKSSSEYIDELEKGFNVYAITLQENKKIDSAIKYFNESLKILINNKTIDKEKILNRLDLIVNLLISINKSKETEEIFTKIESFFEKNKVLNLNDQNRLLSIKSKSSIKSSDPNKLVENITKQKENIAKTSGQNSLDYFLIDTTLIKFFYQKKDFQKAKEYSLQDVKGLSKIVSSTDGKLFLFYEILAKISSRETDYKSLDEYLQKLKSIIEKNPKNNFNLLEYYNLISLNYKAHGQFKESEDMYKNLLGDSKLGIYEKATLKNSLAQLYIENDKTDESEKLLKEAINEFETNKLTNNENYPKFLSNLADLYNKQKKYSEAEVYNKKSLENKIRLLGENSAELAVTYNNMGASLFEQKKYKEAIPYFEKAISCYENKYGKDYYAIAKFQDNLGVINMQMGNLDEAEKLFKRSIQIKSNMLGENNYELIESFINMAILYHNRKDYSNAEIYYDKAISLLINQFENQFDYMNEKDKIRFFNKSTIYFKRYYFFASKYYLKNPSISQKWFDLIMWQKGLVVSSVSNMIKNIQNSNDPEAKKLFDELKQSKNVWINLLLKNDDNSTQRTTEIQKTEKNINEIERKLTEKNLLFKNDNTSKNANWNTIKNRLKNDEAIIEFVSFKNADDDNPNSNDEIVYYALLLNPKTKDYPIVIPIATEKNLVDSFSLYYNVAIDNDGRTNVSQKMLSSGNKLYNYFWVKFEPYLKDTKTIFISPDGMLNQFSFGVLVDNSDEFLINKYHLKYVTSSRTLLEKKENKGSSNKTVLIGNPDFYLESVSTKEATDPNKNVVRSSQETKFDLDPLPGTMEEIGSIYGILTKNKYQVEEFTAEKANKDILREIRSPKVLHIATHGFFDQVRQEDLNSLILKEMKSSAEKENDEVINVRKSNPMYRSGIYLAGIIKGDEYGKLTAFEASDINLTNTELVVLSACETGIGEVMRGEGVFGLRRAFQIAGAESIIMSLWKVPDNETSELMSLFYKNWVEGQDKYIAFWNAQKEMCKKILKVKGKNIPYLWGAFIMVGN